MHSCLHKECNANKRVSMNDPDEMLRSGGGLCVENIKLFAIRTYSEMRGSVFLMLLVVLLVFAYANIFRVLMAAGTSRLRSVKKTNRHENGAD